jgi:mRNA interferase RelE/StbE
MKTIIFTVSAARDLDALPIEGRRQVEAALDRYAISGKGDF